MTKIISWNVNGLRSLVRDDFLNGMLKHDPDIFCFQETKAEPDQLPEGVRNLEGYFSYFASSQLKKGYSGVAIYTKKEPDKVLYGMGIERFDVEGRLLELHFGDLVLLNVYFPNGGMGPERLAYKFDFYDAFLKHIDTLHKKGKHIIFCGDVNTAHEEIDLARPKENEENTGFLPEERAWIDEVIAHGYTDVFRHFYPDKKDAYTYWDLKTRARDRNVGWRIDYFFASNELLKKITSTKILSSVYGSDHCPIEMELSF